MDVTGLADPYVKIYLLYNVRLKNQKEKLNFKNENYRDNELQRKRRMLRNEH